MLIRKQGNGTNAKYPAQDLKNGTTLPPAKEKIILPYAKITNKSGITVRTAGKNKHQSRCLSRAFLSVK